MYMLSKNKKYTSNYIHEEYFIPVVADTTCIHAEDCEVIPSGTPDSDAEEYECRHGWHCLDNICRCGMGHQ